MNMQPSDMTPPASRLGTASPTHGHASSDVRINVDLPKIDLGAARWVKGLLAGALLHAVVIGCFFITAHLSPDVREVPPLALNIDLMPIQTSPVEKADDQPLDVKKTDFVPTPVEPEPEPEEVEEPILEVKPEVVLPKPVKKKKKKKKVTKKVVLKKPVEQRPPEKERRTAAAPVQSEKVESAAQQIGVSAEVLAAKASWQNVLRSYLESRKRYPSNARRRHQEGIVSVSFSVDRQGKVTRVALEKSSNHRLLDEHILALLKRASPLPAPPADVKGNTFPFVLAFAFYIK